MFRNIAVGKIMEAVNAFGRNFSAEVAKAGLPRAVRVQLAQVFDRTLIAVAEELDTDTARDVAEKTRPNVRRWLKV